MFFRSAAAPDQESARMTSPLPIIPRSPWLASPGCTKKAGVPVDAKVDAIFRPTCPDFPMPVTMTRPCAARITSTAAANDALRPSRNAAPSASTPLPSASRVRSADSIAACALSLVAPAGFGFAMMLDTTKTALRQSCRPFVTQWSGRCTRRSLCTVFRIRENLADGLQHCFDCDVVGTSVAYGNIAVDTCTHARFFIALRLKNGRDRVQWFPMPGAGWAEDRDCRRTECCRYMHQSGIVGYRNVGDSESHDRTTQIGACEISHATSTGRDFFCDWRFVGPAENPD